MAAKKKGTVAKVTAAVQDAAASVAQATQEQVIRAVGEAFSLAREDSKGETKGGGGR